MEQVHPVSEFVRNYKSFLDRIKETGNPEVLTVKGRPEYVILDAKSYGAISAELERSRFIQAVNDAIADMDAQRGLPAAAAFAQIRKGLDL